MDELSFDRIAPEPLRVHADGRGDLWKALSASRLGPGESFGEIYLLFTRAGAVRGNHWHRKTTEWFVVVQGRMRCTLALPGTGLRKEFLLDAASPSVLKVPPGVAHRLRAEGEGPALLAAVADREYDAESPDQAPFAFEGE